MTIKRHDELMSEIGNINTAIALLEAEQREWTAKIQKKIVMCEFKKNKLNAELMEGLKIVWPKWMNWFNDKKNKQ